MKSKCLLRCVHSRYLVSTRMRLVGIKYLLFSSDIRLKFDRRRYSSKQSTMFAWGLILTKHHDWVVIVKFMKEISFNHLLMFVATGSPQSLFEQRLQFSLVLHILLRRLISLALFIAPSSVIPLSNTSSISKQIFV